MSSAFTETLHAITSTKLEVLSQQHADFTSHREKVLSSVAATADPCERVHLLLDALKSWRTSDNSTESGGTSTSKSPYLTNIEYFLQQAENDPGIGSSSLSEWERKLTKSLETESVKFEYAELFGKLLTEWVGSPSSQEGMSKKVDGHDSEASSSRKKSENVGRKELHAERAKFEAYVVTPNETDPVAIEAYLEELFSLSKEAKSQLEVVRKRIAEFGEEFLHSKFTVEDLEWTIKSLLSKDLLSNQKRSTLKEFMLNKVVLKEVADVLNMHLSSLASWSWPVGGVTIEMRRYLNGKYRNFMEEELLQAIFLHYLGTKWSIEFKGAFRQIIINPRVWKPSSTPIPKVDLSRRAFFLGEITDYSGWGADALAPVPEAIVTLRKTVQQEQFFMGQLPDSMETSGNPTYDSDVVNSDTIPKPTPMTVKQTMLRIMATECILNNALYGSFTVVGSDLFSFGSSLSHSSLITVLKFFGISGTWLRFFEKFLASPLKLTMDEPPQMRRRGVPMAHSLSDCLGEVLLFCMDYAVNQRANGLFLYRQFDDLWLWDSDSERCATGWKEMQKFARILGLEFNSHKTGSASVGRPLHPDVPRGSIKHGFLKFEPSGNFVIDQEQIDTHIAELRYQLQACNSSVLAWVQVYNKYVSSYFTTNFGTPANCYGKKHIDMVLKALREIHCQLFPLHNGSVTAYLAAMIKERFSVHDIPDGWYYWPLSMGGLEVKNPFIPLYILREHINDDPANAFLKVIEKDEETYARCKESWEDGTRVPGPPRPTWANEGFISFEEYTRYRQEKSGDWANVYQSLLGEPFDCRIETTAEIEAALKRVSNEVGGLVHKRVTAENIQGGWGGRGGFRGRILRGRGGRGGYSGGHNAPEPAQNTQVNWNDMTVYWQWVVACFGEGMIAKWGGLEVVRPGSLPVGMVEAWKSKRMRWDP